MKKSIKRRFVFMFIVMMSIVLGTSTYVLYLKINQAEQSRTLEEIDAILVRQTDDFNNMISTIYRCSFYLQNDKDLVNTFYDMGKDEYESNKTHNKILTNVSMIYEMNLDGRMDFYSTIFFVNKALPCTDLMLPGDRCRLSSVSQDFRMYTTEGIEAEDWFLKTQNNSESLYYFVQGDRLYVSKKIINDRAYNNKDNFLGIALVVMDLNESLNSIHNIGGYQTEVAIMQDDEIILKTNTDSKNDFFDDSDYIVKHVKTDIGIEFVVSIAKEQMGMTKNDILNMLCIYIVIAVLVAAILSILFARIYTKPVVNLARIMQNVKGENELNLHIKKESEDEVGILYDSFNYMIDTINNLLASIKEEEKKRYELEFRLHQNKINPHMLYNTLDSISWMALMEGNDKVAEINGLLSEIYRYSIKYPESVATLAEEIKCVEMYVEIRRNNLNYPIIVNVETNGCENTIVPQFILQPLVENSIIHGHISTKDELIIKITSSIIEKNRLVIEVEDNGKGCDVVEVNKIIQAKDSKHIGLSNVAQRIKLRYGDDYGVLIQNVEGGGTRVILTTPADDKKEI